MAPAGPQRRRVVQQGRRMHLVRPCTCCVVVCHALLTPIMDHHGRYFDMPHTEAAARRIYAKSTADTATATAVMASAARLWKPYSYQIYRRYLRAAERGWAFLATHPDPVPELGWQTPGYCDTSGVMSVEGDRGLRMWAAAELLRATGRAEFRESFERYGLPYLMAV